MSADAGVDWRAIGADIARRHQSAIRAGLVSKCGCQRTFTLHEWRLLELVGIQRIDGDRLELRNCACGSTLGVWVDNDGNPTKEPA